MADPTSPASDPTESAATPRDPGCLPAIGAILMLAVIGLMIACGVGTFFLFRSSPRLAAGTLRGRLIPALEQTTAHPDEKGRAIRLLSAVAEDMETGALEHWQASGVMMRLVRAPLLQWGDLDAILALIAQREGFSDADRSAALRSVQRVRRAIEIDRIAAPELEDALAPVTVPADSDRGFRLNLAASDDAIRDTLKRFDLLSEREKVPDEAYEITLDDIVRLQIEAGTEKGTM